MEKTYAFIRQTLACILLFASTVAAAEIRPEVKVYEEPGWCVWCPSPVASPAGVRYLHCPPFTGNIFNEMNLPLGVFRIDR